MTSRATPDTSPSSGADMHEQLSEPLLPPPSDHSSSSSEHDGPAAQVRLVDGMPLGTSVLLKSLYFLEALGSSAWGRFSTVYYNTHGLDPSQIGLIEGLMPVGAPFDRLFLHCSTVLLVKPRTAS